VFALWLNTNRVKGGSGKSTPDLLTICPYTSSLIDTDLLYPETRSKITHCVASQSKVKQAEEVPAGAVRW
jgi:hypothetical protein